MSLQVLLDQVLPGSRDPAECLGSLNVELEVMGIISKLNHEICNCPLAVRLIFQGEVDVLHEFLVKRPNGFQDVGIRPEHHYDSVGLVFFLLDE